ncbi:hypothetical protein ARALYDRAFT_915540 [Arabidopsis lyrata subsp. lyrata]|uniref:Uncharacterized protein n=1 Tax=Arabidopsis lyrata subsp. lyrata TaxID=81972 RepID=D7MHC6_ARALL|nr:hypothetical protein ARALYDRAFT_915540 [Arabidopsis lyrata subsp. lyrata]
MDEDIETDKDEARGKNTPNASLGVREDGIMTAELLRRLFMDEDVETWRGRAVLLGCLRMKRIKQEEAGNGAVFTSVTPVPEKKQSIIKDQSDREVDVTQNSVFLLGENRWEDPSRLIG